MLLCGVANVQGDVDSADQSRRGDRFCSSAFGRIAALDCAHPARGAQTRSIDRSISSSFCPRSCSPRLPQPAQKNNTLCVLSLKPQLQPLPPSPPEKQQQQRWPSSALAPSSRSPAAAPVAWPASAASARLWSAPTRVLPRPLPRRLRRRRLRGFSPPSTRIRPRQSSGARPAASCARLRCVPYIRCRASDRKQRIGTAGGPDPQTGAERGRLDRSGQAATARQQHQIACCVVAFAPLFSSRHRPPCVL